MKIANTFFNFRIKRQLLKKKKSVMYLSPCFHSLDRNDNWWLLCPIKLWSNNSCCHSGFLDYYLHLYCYILNVSADMSFSLLQVFVKIQKPTWNFEPHPLFNPQGSLVLIPLTITWYKSQVFLYRYSSAVRIEPVTSRWLSL